MLNGVGVDSVGGIFPFSLSLFFFDFLRFSSLFFVFLCCSLILLEDKGKRLQFTAKRGNFTPTPSAPTPSKTSRSEEKGRSLVVRIARPTSLAIWHRGRSHRRPNRSGSPNRRHFASLDLKKHPDFSHCRPTSQDFRRRFFCHFL